MSRFKSSECRNRLTRMSQKSEPALNLALLRVVVGGMMLVAPGFRAGREVAAWHPSRWVVPEGLGWFVELVPIDARLALGAQVMAAFSAFLGILGIRARWAFFSLLLSSFYLYAIAQLTGFVWHDMHLLWFCALLAASPCDDVLAVDAKEPIFSEGKRYAYPIFFLKLLFCAIYFFPGAHKLATSGFDWALSDNLQNQLYWKWSQHSYVPKLRIDQVPYLLQIGGLFTLLFELGFPLLIFWRRTAKWALLMGLGFHLLAQFLFRIPFMSLWLCYVGLIDFRGAVRFILSRLGRDLPAVKRLRAKKFGATGPPSPRALWAVGGLLVAGATAQGVRGQMSSYPFACYPTFQWKVGREMPDLEIVVRDSRGTLHVLAHGRNAHGYRNQRQWAEIWAVAGATRPVDSERIKKYVAARTGVRRIQRKRSDLDLQTRASAEPRPTQEAVVAYRVYRDVTPERRKAAPTRRVHLSSFDIEEFR